MAQVDGANTFRGETVSQYVQGVQDAMLHDPGSGLQIAPSKYTANFQDRYMYNPTFESVYAMVPSVPPILLILIPAILMAISIVREKELGSIIISTLRRQGAWNISWESNFLTSLSGCSTISCWSPWRLSSSAFRSREAF
jgi:hypothetical protein